MGLLLKLLSTAAADALDVWVGIITGVALSLPSALSGAVSIDERGLWGDARGRSRRAAAGAGLAAAAG
jgi:hypothetical protein